MSEAEDLDALYRHRFNGDDVTRKMAIWREIAGFLERWISCDAAVLDIACDEGYFIRNVRAAERWATDIRDVGAGLGADILQQLENHHVAGRLRVYSEQVGSCLVWPYR